MAAAVVAIFVVDSWWPEPPAASWLISYELTGPAAATI